MFAYGGNVVAVEARDEGGSPSIVARVLFKAQNCLGDIPVIVGVGRAWPGVEGMFRSYREANWAARVGVHREGPNRSVDFSELGSYAWLEPLDFAAGDTDIVAIQTLDAHDATHGTRLIETLNAYLESGSAKEAADRLFVHRNTLRYRLDSIKKLTGLDPHEHEARLVLGLQLRLAVVRGDIDRAARVDPQEQKATH